MRTFLDELISYPARALKLISEDIFCVGLIRNIAFANVNDKHKDDCFDKNLFTYQFIDDTVLETAAFVWAEADVPSVQNMRIKGMRLYITVACHKQFMPLSHQTFSGMLGNRRDNIVRYIDRLLNFQDVFGIGKLILRSVKTLSAPQNFTIKEIEYEVPEFNYRGGVR